MSGAGVILSAENLSKSFSSGGLFTRRSQLAVDDVSFDIRERRIVALVGQSGSGKSTVAKMLAGLHEPTRGVVRLAGQVALGQGQKPHARFRRQVQMVFQDPFASLNPVHRVRHHLARPLLRHGLVQDEAELTRRVSQLLELVGSSPDATIDKYPHELSGGQRQRVAIARALAIEPMVLIADEPTSMLDVSIRVGILNLFKNLRDEHGKSLLLVTHDLASARYVADEVMVMYAGRLVERGPTESVVSLAKHPYTQLLLSAAPDPHDQIRRSQPPLPPSALKRTEDTLQGVGCSFAPRCPRATSRCRGEVPLPRVAGASHWVSCHEADVVMSD